MESEIWKPYILTTDSSFFPIFQQVIKQAEGKDSVIIKVLNKQRTEILKKECHDWFKLIFEWQEDKDICGIDILKKVK